MVFDFPDDRLDGDMDGIVGRPRVARPENALVPTTAAAAKSVQMRFTIVAAASGAFERFCHRTYIAMLE